MSFSLPGISDKDRESTTSFKAALFNDHTGTSPPADVDLVSARAEASGGYSLGPPAREGRRSSADGYSCYDILGYQEDDTHGEDPGESLRPLESAFSDLAHIHNSGSVCDSLPSNGITAYGNPAALDRCWEGGRKSETAHVAPAQYSGYDSEASADEALYPSPSDMAGSVRFAGVLPTPLFHAERQDGATYGIEDEEEGTRGGGVRAEEVRIQLGGRGGRTVDSSSTETTPRGLPHSGPSAVFEEDDEGDDGFGSDSYGGGRSARENRGGTSSVSLSSYGSDIRTVLSTSLGKPTAIIGQGGDRGSQVYRLDPEHVERMKRAKQEQLARKTTRYGGPLPAPAQDSAAALVDVPLLEALVQEAIAYKLYPASISVNELEFIETSFAMTRLREHILSPKNTDTNTTSRKYRTRAEKSRSKRQSFLEDIGASFRLLPAARCRTDEEKMLYAACHLVFPGAIVQQEGEKRGLLMPLYDYSLKQFLVKHTNEKDRSRTRHCTDEDSPRASSLLSSVSYSPIRDATVVAAIAFQILEGIRLLNHHMPHNALPAATGTGSASGDTPTFTGFTHNDLHMDNILLSRRGRVAVCDFELVEHLPVPVDAKGKRRVRERSRLPPPCRRSPHGVFSESSDVWAIGLLIVALLTGVDPFFSNEGIINDFGNGPLLKPSSQAYAGESVVDWETNIAPHVEGLLHRADPTGALVRDAAPLLDVCAKTLINKDGRKPENATALLREPVFASFLERPESAEAVVGEWVRSFPCDAPDDAPL